VTLTVPPKQTDGEDVEAHEQLTQAPLEPTQKLRESAQETSQATAETRSLRRQKRTTTLIGYFLLGVGMIVLVGSILLASTVMAFIGLGLTCWGLLAFFVQPKRSVGLNIMNATAISSLRTIDKVMAELGYREKGVYIRAGDSDRAVVFVPTKPFSMIPKVSDLEDRTFLRNPKGLLIPPPGLALAGLIERKLGFKLVDCGLEALIEALPKVLAEDLEIVTDVEIEVNEKMVRFKLFDSIYGDFCSEVRDASRRCGLGCPMCSALASILVVATGRPVLCQDETLHDRVTESTYELLTGPRM
jgi:hypothetical protein